MTSSVALLDREMYTEPEAARLLRVAPSTLHYWLEGKAGRGSKRYEPVIRTEPKGTGASVTWAEFVEAGCLLQYRRDFKVPLPELRTFIDDLRDRFNIPYPLADRRPMTVGRELVYQAQLDSKLPGELWLVNLANGQLLLTGASEAFLQRATWEGDVATGWRPHAEPDSTVLISPRLRFGRPAVQGISTEIVWEHAESGESDEEIADAFGLTLVDVTWALTYEQASRVTKAS